MLSYRLRKLVSTVDGVKDSLNAPKARRCRPPVDNVIGAARGTNRAAQLAEDAARRWSPPFG